jgi:hypothetical protein
MKMTKEQAERGAKLLEDINDLQELIEDFEDNNVREVKFYRSINSKFFPEIIESLNKLKGNREIELQEL